MHVTRRSTFLAALLCAVIAAAGVAALAAAGPAVAAAARGADGNYHDWKTKVNYWDLQGGIPWHDESEDFCNSLGVGHYNGKYYQMLCRWGGNDILYAAPYKMTPTRPQRDGQFPTKQLPRSESPCAISDVGAPKQDVVVFGNEYNHPEHLTWRLLSQGFDECHLVGLPSGYSTRDMLWDFDDHRYLMTATQYQGRFAVAWLLKDRHTIVLVTGLDLMRSSGARWMSDDGGAVRVITFPDKWTRQVTLTSVTHGDREYLALGYTYGDFVIAQPRPYTKYRNVEARVRLYSDVAADAYKEIHVPAERESSWYSPVVDDRDPGNLYDTRGIAMLQGSVEGSPNGGDLLQIFTQNAGKVNGAFCDQFVARYEYSLDTDKIVDTDYMYQTGRCAHQPIESVNFFAFKSFELTKKKAYGSFDEYRQHLNVISTSGGDGTFRGWLSDFPSDYLVPIASETVNGGPVEYPTPVDSDSGPTEGTIVGVVFGPPPFPLNQRDYKDATSQMSFADRQSKETKTTRQIGGSVSATAGMEILGCGVSSTASMGYDYQAGDTKTTSKEVGWDLQHSSADLAQTGWLIGYYPSYVIQAFKRFDTRRQEVPASHIYLTLPSGNASKESVDLIPFDMVDPTRSATSKGMTAHAKSSDFANPLWKNVPLEEAGRHGESIDQNSLSSGYGQHGWCSIGKEVTESTSHSVNFKINATVKGPAPSKVKVEVHGGASKEETTSSAQNTKCDLFIATRPQKSAADGDAQAAPGGASDTIVDRMSEIVYWMKAKDSSAYWIPDWARSRANDQTPWCVDYYVRSWTPKDSAAESVGDVCSVGVMAEPTDGGDVAIAQTPGVAGTNDPVDITVGGVARATAVPEEGYRFVRWRRAGGQLVVGSPKNAATDVAVRSGGGATMVAVFEPLTPTRLSVTRRGSHLCDIVLEDAPLPQSLTPAGQSGAPETIGLSIGGVPTDIPPTSDADERSPEPLPSVMVGSVQVDLGASLAGETPYVVAVDSPWGAGSRVRVTLDPGAGTWDCTAVGVRRASDFMRQCAAGEATLALTGDEGEVLGVGTYTLATRARLGSARLPAELGGGVLPTAAGRPLKAAVDMSKAKIVVTTPKDPAKTALVLSGIKLDRRLFNRRGIVIALAGDRLISAGRFGRSAGAWLWKGRSLQLYDVHCRYRDGSLTLGLRGAFLRADLDQLVNETVTLGVINGRRRGDGAMLTTVKSLAKMTPVGLAP
jgi:hypothetical protein